ncbi:MCE family protein [Nocardioides marmoribigeumensis]|uniref:Phospholipid/cholesterol/gamma-HCH transport system substrate-binding protein n=1 Tax=Nocardioides marmoribigeumensis TaxID=433649 RepID=A0ABU2BR59_9ACTN|nr:MCE family protein [Nocardioides marmoribigeumensis]MDR7361107.1 phospholipid/cholesterol/gamma-HCH transport system substrate-binding protein [Nocardioides marmoribigeumensis]
MLRRENDAKEEARLVVAGIAYLVAVALLGALSIAIYTKAFTHVTTVTLVADRAGLQLAKYGDVRYDGVLVGQIRGIDQTGDKARITLALDPDAARSLPRDVDASIMPTTLFGRKFISLDPPARSGPEGIKDGTVIPPERVTTSVELGRVLERLFPLLRTVRPADLSATLGALATALNGRGAQLGDTLEKLDGYLTTMNPHLPELQEDLRLLATVTSAYDVAAPDLVRALGNLTVTSRTVKAKRAELAGLFKAVTDVSDTTSTVLEDNEAAAIQATQSSKPILGLLEKYAPEYNCLLRGVAAYKPILIKTFEGGRVKQFAEFPTTQRRGYDRRDRPAYDDTRGPRCYGLPHHVPIPWPGLDLRNGTDLDSKKGLGNSYFPGGAEPGPSFLQDLVQAFTGQSFPAGMVDPGNTRDGRRASAALLSTRTGRSVSRIPALSSYMYAPMTHAGEGAPS